LVIILTDPLRSEYANQRPGNLGVHLENDLPELVDVLCGTVNGGASLGFLSPFAQRGRRPLLLNTRRGEIGKRFYKRLGYREVGVVPGYSLGPKGERFDSVSLYQELTA
jgi:hypothetical protein